MAHDAMQDPNGSLDGRSDVVAPIDDGLDPMQALGYEAADPLLQARLWGESPVREAAS